MSDYLHTVAVRNLTSPLAASHTEPLPLVQPRALMRFEPAALDASLPVAAHSGAAVEDEPISAPDPSTPGREPPYRLPANLLDELSALASQRGGLHTAQPSPASASQWSAAQSRGRATEAGAMLPAARVAPVAEAAIVTEPDAADRLIERIILRETARPALLPWAEGQQITETRQPQPQPALVRAARAPHASGHAIMPAQV
ncbi:MAG: hypothetical protein KDD75_22355, partial [Caldilineaceae bacterium]|nr:hypothetical protein [Caldilineaceae bacterium]